MGKIDQTGRLFFGDEEVFAELINVHIYGGKQVVNKANLIKIEKDYPLYRTKGRDKERDILMRDKRSHIRYGLELEIGPDYSMPERVYLYDACDYEKQIRKIIKPRDNNGEDFNFSENKSGFQKGDRIDPVITLVLYLGEGRWKGRNHLSELFRINSELKDLLGQELPDIHIRLIEADYVDPEQYSTELKIFFRAMQYRRNKEKLRRLMRSEEFQKISGEAEEAIRACLGHKQLSDKMKKGKMPMCKAIDGMLKDSEKAGMKKGLEKERTTIVQKMIKEGLDKAIILKCTQCTEAEYARAAKAAKG